MTAGKSFSYFRNSLDILFDLLRPDYLTYAGIIPQGLLLPGCLPAPGEYTEWIQTVSMLGYSIYAASLHYGRTS